MVSLLSQKPRLRNFSWGYCILACPEAAKENVSQGYSVLNSPEAAKEKF